MPVHSKALFDYTVRVSRRARRVNLCVKPQSGLEIIIPQRFDKDQIPEILQRNQSWILRALEKWQKQKQSIVNTWPPDVLELRAIERTLTLSYVDTGESDSIQFNLHENHLMISGSTGNQSLLSGVLAEVVKTLAREELSCWLQILATEHALTYKSVTIRGQKSRWGSCSAKGGISLNYKLLFLPQSLTRYVLLHELAHTRHLNHSQRYWTFLTKLEPETRELDKRLRTAGQYVPCWLDGGIG